MRETSKNTELGEIVSEAILDAAHVLSIGYLSVYFVEKDGRFYQKCHYGSSQEYSSKFIFTDDAGIINEVAESRCCKVIDAQTDAGNEEKDYPDHHGNSSIAYIPVGDKERGVFCVIVLCYEKPVHAMGSLDGILKLIGHRIGLGVENVILRDKHMESEERYGLLFNNIPHSIFMLDGKDFTVVDSNVRAQSAYGYTKEEFMGMPFLNLSDGSNEEISNALKSISEKQYCRIPKRRFFTKRKKSFFVNVNISPVRYDNDDLIIASTTDITKSVEKETQLIQAAKMSTLGLMAAGMAHEINQPLNIIQVCADYFIKMLNRKRSIPENDLLCMTNDIVSSVSRISEIIRHVRDFSRQSEVIKNRIDINNPIRDASRILTYKINECEIAFNLDLEPDLPPIMADHNRLEQVFISLINNSIDAINDKCRQKKDQKNEKLLLIKSFVNNGMVVVTIKDTGIGIPEVVREKIFEPFFTTKETGRGTGLGASTSYGIVKDYDGAITFESEEGKGTTFEISFPAVDAA